jgi:hypothetical protein
MLDEASGGARKSEMVVSTKTSAGFNAGSSSQDGQPRRRIMPLSKLTVGDLSPILESLG